MLIPTSQNTRSITDMRENTIKLLEEVKKLGLVYLFNRTNPEAVILSIEEFQSLQELIEDHLDELEAEKLSREKVGRKIPLKQVIKRYQQSSRV
ncbi:MAG: hypothetical protein UW69_C0089G0008 [Microgenomates group bacterium GW2011_GWA2_44_7]|nr:MAG: hypothetical protein UW69_C0089G0008 [Microgenomates group bacterium GW2011_GWA2_44_7]KKT77980.1 MAG: hypothetical protein UW73_C0009G0079 [Microgenomates group bacterium GW2011_GWB1_44_8]